MIYHLKHFFGLLPFEED